MTQTRCKFKVLSVTDHGNGNLAINSTPVYSSDPTSENHAFWSATPAGVFNIQVNKPEAVAWMQPGVEFYLDVIPVAAQG